MAIDCANLNRRVHHTSNRLAMADIIQLLPDHVANQIAAGEVIQRPASAVKEMLENAIDSGASEITLSIKDAGRTLIQVVDNGCGMSETDARMCFERHATSKIREANDIHSIRTMGFRGEAMASIAAIAHVELKTKMMDNELGTKLCIEGSKVVSHENCTTNNGSSISVKNLFFNVPARRNFLKSDNVEMKHILDEFHRVAIANEHCAFSLYQNNKEVYHLPKSVLKQRIVGIFGSKYNEKLVPVSEETTLVNVYGFVGKPEFSKKTRGEQYFFVNKRFVKSAYLHHAINNAFKDLISDGYHPSYFLFLDIDPKYIDINIHPTKTEIKFEDDKSIYAIIRSSVKRALGIFNLVPSLDFDNDPSFVNIPKATGQSSLPETKVDPQYNPFNKTEKATTYHPPKKNNTSQWEKLFDNIPDISNNDTPNKLVEDVEKAELSLFQLDHRYIVTNYNSVLLVIHQQRAHERILFEHYMGSQSHECESQQLLFPKTIEVNPSHIAIIKEISHELLNIGFRFDFLNSSSLVILGTPPEIEMDDLEQMFEAFVEQYNNQSTLEKNNKFALSLAKSLSIKLGRKLNESEMLAIVENLFSCQSPNTTVNGKPTFIQMTLEDLSSTF